MLQWNILDNLGIKPVFIDINLNDFGPDYKSLEKLLSRENAKCFSNVSFWICSNLDLILNLCEKYNGYYRGYFSKYRIKI